MTDASPCSHLQFFGAREFCPDCGLSRTEALVEACAPFLKDDETPAECIVRNRRDVDGCLTMLIDERRKVESLRSRLAEARCVCDEQATDAGLWFVAEMVTEAYLQAALRRLHAAVEGTADSASHRENEDHG